MAITTTVQFAQICTLAEHEAINAQIAILVSQGVTDGTKVMPEGSTPMGPGIRTWTTVEAADGWVTFVQTVQSVPPTQAFVSQ
jgi:hypothetical protein